MQRHADLMRMLNDQSSRYFITFMSIVVNPEP